MHASVAVPKLHFNVMCHTINHEQLLACKDTRPSTNSEQSEVYTRLEVVCVASLRASIISFLPATAIDVKYGFLSLGTFSGQTATVSLDSICPLNSFSRQLNRRLFLV